MAGRSTKHPYTVTCGTTFRDSVTALAKKRNVNAGDLARSVLLMLPAAAIEQWPDPGEPEPGERETVIVKSGPASGRPWRRKPRLQVRLPEGYDPPLIRRALALALAIDRGNVSLAIDGPRDPARPRSSAPAVEGDETAANHERVAQTHLVQKLEHEHNQARDEIERLKALVSVLAFDPLPDGVATRQQALHILGFAPNSRPDKSAIRAKFRMLATIYHPDSRYGDHTRMSQLNAAMQFLTRQVRT